MAFTWLTGAVIDRVSYTPIFLIAGLMPIAALAIVQLFIPQISATHCLLDREAPGGLQNVCRTPQRPDRLD